MIGAILFDYGNVIARFDHMIFFRRISRCSALTPDEMRQISIAQREVLLEYERGRISSDEFYHRVVEACQLSMSLEDFKAAFVRIFEPIPETIELIENLKPRYKLALASNTNEWHFASEIRLLSVFPLFDAVTLSFEVGVMKPDGRFYCDALHKLGVPAHSCVYIDDIPEYVEAAKGLGFTAIQYTNHASLLSSLRATCVEL